MTFSQALLWCRGVCGFGVAVCLLCLLVRPMRKVFRWVAGGTVLAAATLLYYPIAAGLYGMEHWFKPVAMAVYAAVRLFLIDGDFQQVQEMLKGVSETVRIFRTDVSYETAMLWMYVLAPVTTVTVITSLFREAMSWLRLHTVGIFKKWYVFSELSDRSLALAEDICKKHRIYPMIIFHDVYRKNEESNAERLERADRLRAVCFKKDVSHLKRPLFPRRLEFFMIGANESENLDQAVRLTERYKKRRNTAIYVWARSPESEFVLDSIDTVTVDPRRGDKNASLNKRIFKLRRIDDVEIFAWNTLREIDLFRKEKMAGGNVISILIVGMGDYGNAFLRTAAWMYQRDDVVLEINVVDVRGNVQKQLRHQYPELMKKNDCFDEGEAHYSIRFFENTDIFEDDLEQLLLSEEQEEPTDEKAVQRQNDRERLKRTTAAFVTLGDDDINIRAALQLRQLFDRVQYNADNQDEAVNICDAEMKEVRRLENGGEQKEEQKRKEKIKELNGKVGKVLKARVEGNTKQLEKWGKTTQVLKLPEIYTPVYDERKVGNVTLRDTADEVHELRSADGVPYNIRFMGSFRAQNQYDTIAREQLEKDALAYHMQWSSIDYEEGDLQKYDQYEYYRHSSMAQAIHKKMLAEYLELQCRESKEKAQQPAPEKKGCRDKQKEADLKAQRSCKCEICERSKKIEHMRWNAYMRTRGYCCPETDRKYQVKSFRGKLHWELIEYKLLDEVEKSKDGTAV